jgi:hypothetical protein
VRLGIALGAALAASLSLVGCVPGPTQGSGGDRGTEAIPEAVPVTRVSIAGVVLNNFAWLYAMWDRSEWGGCLYGGVSEGTLHVESMELAEMGWATETMVFFNCRTDERFVGVAHNHLPLPGSDACSFSPVDEMMNAYPISFVVCAPDKYIFRILNRPPTHEGSMPAVRR